MLRPFASFSLLLLAFSSASGAQEAIGEHLSLELNALASVDNACQISFLIQNGHPVDIGKAVFEAVLFDTDGRVERLTLFDVGTLPAGRPRVRQFAVPGLACTSLGQLLINGATTCEGEGVPDDACTKGLTLGSRTDVELSG